MPYLESGSLEEGSREKRGRTRIGLASVDSISPGKFFDGSNGSHMIHYTG
jgi:hypothetical protein